MMRLRRSFRLRLALQSVLVSGVVLGLFAAWAWVMTQRADLGRVDDSLREIAHRHLFVPHDPGHWAQVDESLQFVFGENTGRVVTLVVGEDQRLLHRSAGWPEAVRVLPGIPASAFTDPVPALPPPYDAPYPPPPPPPPPHGDDGWRHSPPPECERRDDHRPPDGRDPFRRVRGGPPRGPGPHGPPPGNAFEVYPLALQTVIAGDEAWRVAVFRNPEVTFAIAVSMEGHAERTAAARTAFVAAMLAALALIAAGSWYLATRALAPVRRLSDTLARVSAKGLDKRLNPAGTPLEYEQLIAQFNQMMERLERSFAQAARFSADAAHELKTPLAVLQGELEQAIQTAPKDVQELLGGLLEEVQRLKSITQKLLLLSRADAGQLTVHSAPVDLSRMVSELADDIEAAAPELKVTRSIQEHVVVAGDPDLLRQAVLNLGDNAVKHNRPGGSIIFTVSAGANNATLEVTNSGSIPHHKREKIFDRFVRVDDARTRRVDGAGLGLSLAREIARAHGGDLTLQPTDNDSVSFALRLPQAYSDLRRGVTETFCSSCLE